MIRRPIEGGKLLKDIKIYKEVKVKIAEALRSINTTGQNMDYMPPVYRNTIRDEFKWACSQKTCSELILVWHIATGMCEIELSRLQEREISWYLSPLYWINSLCSYRKPFLVDLESLEGDLRSYYITANSISRYCAYLLITTSELLPDNQIFPRMFFDNTVSKAREVLRSCDSLETIYWRLRQRGERLEREQNHTPDRVCEKRISILEEGARLGYALITKMEPRNRWEMLSEYWANLLLYLAPCNLMEHHDSHLEKGGEFITILWALFCHSGIFEQGEEEEDEWFDARSSDQNAEKQR